MTFLLKGEPLIRGEQFHVSELDPGTAEYVGAATGQASELNPVGLGDAMPGQAQRRMHLQHLTPGDQYGVSEFGEEVLLRKGLDPEDPRARRLSLEEANEKGKDVGLRFSEPPTQGQFDYLSDLKKGENERAMILAKAPSYGAMAAGFISQLAAGAVDPLNVASAFIPVVGPARYANMVRTMGRPGARLTKGAVEGAVGAGLVTPVIYAQAQGLQQEYNASDAMMDVVFGATFGAGLHWSGGQLKDAYRREGINRLYGYLRENDQRVSKAGFAEQQRLERKTLANEIIDRRKIRVQEGENASIVASMDRATQRDTLNAAVRSVSTDQTPKVDALLRHSPELRPIAIPDKRFPATARLRSDLTAAHFVDGSRAGEIVDSYVRDTYVREGEGVFSSIRDALRSKYKKLGETSVLSYLDPGFYNKEAGALLEHPDQLIVYDPEKKVFHATGHPSPGAIFHEMNRALDDLYGATGEERGGYRYSNKDMEGQTAHRAALRELYGAEPERAPATPSPEESVDLFSRRDEPIMGRDGPAAADRAWDIIQEGKDKDLETMIAEEEIMVLEDIARNITGDAKDLGIMDKVIPLEERKILQEAATKQGKQKVVKDLFSAVDAAVEREVKTERLDEAELLVRGGAEAVDKVLFDGQSVKSVVQELVDEGLVPRSVAVTSIKNYYKFVAKEETAPTGEALEKAIRAIQDGEDVDVALANAVRAGEFFDKTQAAADEPVGAAAEFKAPGEDEDIEDAFDDIAEMAIKLIEEKNIRSKAQLAEAEARIVQEEHTLLEANTKTADLASKIEKGEFDEAQRNRTLREGSGSVTSGERARARSGSPGGALEDGLFATRTRRDGEAAGGVGAVIERERSAAGGERAAPETTISIGRDTIPRRVITPDQSIEVSVEPIIVELDSLTHAHGDFQPRDRSRKESQTEVLERAWKLDPEQLMPTRVADAGAPIVIQRGDELMIISGNGRVMSLREIHKRSETMGYKAAEYRARLGPAADGYRRPVLVMRITDTLSDAELVKFADRANRSRIAEMSVTERAQRDADTAGIELMMLYQGGDFTKKENQEFLRAFTRKVATAQEMGEMSKNGVLTKTGVDRLNAAVLASAYDDTGVLSLMLESTDNNIKSIAAAYRDVAPLFMKLRAEIAQGLVREEMDITPFMMEAARFVQEARDKGVKITNALAQVDAFHPMDPVVDRLIRQFYNPQLSRANSALRIGETLRLYAEAAREKRLGGFFTDDTNALDVMGAAERKFAREADEELLAPDEGDPGAGPDPVGAAAPQPASAGPGQVPGAGGAGPGAAAPAAAAQGIERQVNDAYSSMARHPQDWVSLTKLREKLGGSRAEQDATLKSMYLEKKINLSSDDDQGSLTPADRDAALLMGRSKMHLVSIQSFSGAVEPAPAAAAPSPVSAAKAVAGGLRASFDEGGEPAFRAKLAGMKVAEMRAAAKADGIPGKGRSRAEITEALVEGVKSGKTAEPAAPKKKWAEGAPLSEAAKEARLERENEGRSLNERMHELLKDQPGIREAAFDEGTGDYITLIEEDGLSVSKRLTGRTLVIVERFIRQAKEIKEMRAARDWDGIKETLGDMIDDVVRLEASGDDRAQVVTQWVRLAAQRQGVEVPERVDPSAPAATVTPTPVATPSPLREAFFDYLETDAPVKGSTTIAKALGINVEAALKLLDEGVDAGWLKINDKGFYMRVPKNRRPARGGGPLDKSELFSDDEDVRWQIFDEEAVGAKAFLKKAHRLSDEQFSQKYFWVVSPHQLVDAAKEMGYLPSGAYSLAKMAPELSAVADRLRDLPDYAATEPATATEIKAYHGTSEIFNKFDKSRSSDGAVFFASRADTADGFIDSERGGKVHAVYIETKGFKEIESPGHWAANKSEIAKAKKEGYKGLIIRNVPDETGYSGNFDEIITWTDKTVRGIDGAPSLMLDPPTMTHFENELVSFLESDRKKTYIYGPNNEFSLYIRNGIRLDPETFDPVGALEIASIEMNKTGEGSFRQMLDAMMDIAWAKNIEMIYVENVITDRFANFFRKSGWLEDNQGFGGPPSFFRSVLPPADKPAPVQVPLGWGEVGGREAAEIERETQTRMAIMRSVEKALHRVPDVIRFQIMDRISFPDGGNAAGVYSGVDRMIRLSAAMTKSPENVVNHEIFHALKHIGAFTDFEWTIIRNTYAEGLNVSQKTRDRYTAYWIEEARKAAVPDEMAPNMIQNKLVEEWAATDFGNWKQKRGSERETPLGMLWGRVDDILTDLWRQTENWARRAIGVDEKLTATDIFKAIEDGSIAKRWDTWNNTKKGNPGDGPMSTKSMAADDHVEMLNRMMRETAQDKSESIGRLQEEALKALAPCAGFHL